MQLTLPVIEFRKKEDMKIKIDDKVIYDLTDTIKKVICNEIHIEEFDEDIERRLTWIVSHKYEQCFRRLKAEWDDKLASRGIKYIPTDRTQYAELVFSQPDYKGRSARETD